MNLKVIDWKSDLAHSEVDSHASTNKLNKNKTENYEPFSPNDFHE